jgi:hypothetical protein
MKYRNLQKTVAKNMSGEDIIKNKELNKVFRTIEPPVNKAYSASKRLA